MDESEEPFSELFEQYSITEPCIFLGVVAAAAAAKLLQSCPTLCDPTDGSPPGSPIPGILQARTLEWVAISFSSAWKWKVKVKSLSHVRLLATPWTAAHQAPWSMGFSRQEYWSGVPLPSPRGCYTFKTKWGHSWTKQLLKILTSHDPSLIIQTSSLGELYMTSSSSTSSTSQFFQCSGFSTIWSASTRLSN